MSETVEMQLPTGEGLTFEKVWAMFQEAREQMKEEREQREKSRLEFDRQMEKSRLESEREWKEIHELQKETDRLFKETERRFKETDRLFKETDKKIKQTNEQYGGLSHCIGEVVEHLVAPGIEEKFNEMGYHFSEVYDGENRIKNEKGEKIAQIDILMENGETVLAVEVKSKPNSKDVKEHIERLKKLREVRRGKKDGRKIIGALAGAVFKDNVKTAAQDAGLFVIVQTGDTMNIEVPEGWKPKAW
jgi:hypothetical protein